MPQHTHGRSVGRVSHLPGTHINYCDFTRLRCGEEKKIKKNRAADVQAVNFSIETCFSNFRFRNVMCHKHYMYVLLLCTQLIRCCFTRCRFFKSFCRRVLEISACCTAPLPAGRTTHGPSPVWWAKIFLTTNIKLYRKCESENKTMIHVISERS